jgi:hypothetical protein
VFHSRDFPVPNSRYPDDLLIPAFPGNQSGIPGLGRVKKSNSSVKKSNFGVKKIHFFTLASMKKSRFGKEKVLFLC